MLVLPVLADAILPAWLVLPIGALTMIIIAGHVTAIQSVEMPLRRRRIRTVNGVLMIFTTALIAVAVSLTDSGREVLAQPEQARRFVLLWGMITSFVGLMIMLAALDSLTTLQLHAEKRRAVRAKFRESLEQAVAARLTPDTTTDEHAAR